MFSVKSIRKEISKFVSQDKVLSEFNRLKGELERLRPYKALNEPTKKHLLDLEKSYNFIVKRISKTQKQIDKEFNNALDILKMRRKEAEGQFKKLQKMALDQKNGVEKTIKMKLKKVTGTKTKPLKRKTASKKKITVRKKASTKKKTAKKVLRKKAVATKATTRKTKAKKKAAKKVTRKKKTSRK